MALVCSHAAWAGDFSWTQDKVSAAISRADSEVVVIYEAPGGSAQRGSRRVDGPPGLDGAAGHAIKRVYAGRSYHGDAVVRTSLCWNGTQRCVPLEGGSVNTSAFNGLDASKPIYLVHKVLGKGPLPAPIYVKGTVIVWFGPQDPSTLNGKPPGR
ncbi:MAG: flagellar protein FlhE [Burkholderiaceae bacterium]